MYPKGIPLFINLGSNSVRTGTFKLFRRTMSGLVSHTIPPPEESFRQKFVRVCIVGADSPTGEATAFLLKQNPVVSQLYLHGDVEVRGTAADLRHLDTRCEVKEYYGKNSLSQALKRADIVVLVGKDQDPLNATAETKVRHEIGRIIETANACTKYAPKSLIAVCIHPVSATLPLVSAVFKRTPWYHPGRIIGAVSLLQIRANSLAARFQDLDPVCVHVPLTGGPDNDNIVALFSRATPVSILPPDCCNLQERLREIECERILKNKVCKMGITPFSEAFGINHLVTTMGIGLCGDDKAITPVFVRQNVVNSCKHLVMTVKFGPGGIVHNYGVPKLNGFELKHVSKAILQINFREQMALNILEKLEKHKHPNIKSTFELTPHSSKKDPKKGKD